MRKRYACAREPRNKVNPAERGAGYLVATHAPALTYTERERERERREAPFAGVMSRGWHSRLTSAYTYTHIYTHSRQRLLGVRARACSDAAPRARERERVR